MKTNLFNWAIKLAMLVGVGYLLSIIITQEVVTFITLLIIALTVRFVFKITISILFTIIKWICIIGGIGLLLSSI